MLIQKLKGKDILFIGVKFYHYHEEIKAKMESYGANVTFFAERDTSIMYGIVNRLFHSYLVQYQLKHYSSILKEIAGKKYDYFFVIRGYKMPFSFVQSVKKFNPGITCIMYQWDANINSPFLNLSPQFNIIKEFDKALSFDYKDVQENSELLTYSPTFYTDEIKKLKVNDSEILRYDLFYFGSYLPERYQGLLKIKEFAKSKNLSLKIHFYMPLRYFLIERLKGTSLNTNLLSFKKMDRNKYLELFKKSKVIVDVSNAKQTGMAMRILDALGAGKKILTTNKWIIKEPGFDADQIAIIDINDIKIPCNFLTSTMSVSTLDYSLDKWLDNLFS